MTTALMSPIDGLPVVTDTSAPDGAVYVIDLPGLPKHFLIGVLSEHRTLARRIVREGMADILAWLGEPVVPKGSGEWVLASLREWRRETAA